MDQPDRQLYRGLLPWLRLHLVRIHTPLAERLNEVLGLTGTAAYTAGDLSVVFSTYSMTSIVAMIFGGALVDKFGPKWIIFAAGVMRLRLRDVRKRDQCHHTDPGLRHHRLPGLRLRLLLRAEQLHQALPGEEGPCLRTGDSHLANTPKTR